MLKLNLKKGPTPINLRAGKPWAAGLLLFLLLWQGFALWQKNAEAVRKRAEVDALKNRLTALQEQQKTLVLPDDLESMNGAVAARNEWLALRGKSPLHLLARLETERPGAVELKSFESDGSGGTIKMVAGDMDSASRYMNAVFGNKTGRLAMEERVSNGILVTCSWTE